MAEVAVICTVYNAAEFLQKALDSVIAQTFPNWEMLVMDDGSTDPRVGEILAGVDDARIRIERHTPTVEERRATVRYATLINQGVARTTAPLLSYLASDDYYLPDRLERMTRAMKEGVSVVYGAQVCVDKDDNYLSTREVKGVLGDAAQRVDHNSVLHTRESFERAGGWPEDNGLWVEADAHFWTRLHTAGYLFYPVLGGPTDVKSYHPGCVGDMVPFGREPWA